MALEQEMRKHLEWHVFVKPQSPPLVTHTWKWLSFPLCNNELSAVHCLGGTQLFLLLCFYVYWYCWWICHVYAFLSTIVFHSKLPGILPLKICHLPLLWCSLRHTHRICYVDFISLACNPHDLLIHSFSLVYFSAMLCVRNGNFFDTGWYWWYQNKIYIIFRNFVVLPNWL